MPFSIIDAQNLYAEASENLEQLIWSSNSESFEKRIKMYRYATGILKNLVEFAPAIFQDLSLSCLSINK